MVLSSEDFNDNKLADAEVQGLLSKIDFLYWPEYEKFSLDVASEVRVKLNNGAGYSYKVNVPKGDSGNPTTRDNLWLSSQIAPVCLFRKERLRRG